MYCYTRYTRMKLWIGSCAIYNLDLPKLHVSCIYQTTPHDINDSATYWHGHWHCDWVEVWHRVDYQSVPPRGEVCFLVRSPHHQTCCWLVWSQWCVAMSGPLAQWLCAVLLCPQAATSPYPHLQHIPTDNIDNIVISLLVLCLVNPWTFIWQAVSWCMTNDIRPSTDINPYTSEICGSQLYA